MTDGRRGRGPRKPREPRKLREPGEETHASLFDLPSAGESGELPVISREVRGDRTILTVSDLNRLIRGTLEENFVSVWVEGEISNLSLPPSGHLYFTLKDERAQIRGVVFRSTASWMTFRLEDGMAVILRGRVTVYEPRGEYQIVADRVEPAGIGGLQVAFLQLKEKLSREGLFDPSRKLPIPPHPRRVGVVTSPSGAVIHDIVTVLSRRRALVDLLLMPVRVQGEGAAEEIAAAIADFNRIGGVDVLIVGRGGGSLEDLWAFNEEVVARAVAASRIPVISAVGHEVDFTICDFVADLRAPTPSAAAEMVALSGVELSQRVAGARERLTLSMKGILDRSRDRLHATLNRLRDPAMVIGLHQIRLDDVSRTLEGSMIRLLEERRRLLAEREKQLGVLSPRSVVLRWRERVEASRERLLRSVEWFGTSRRERLSRLCAALNALSPLAVLGRGYALARRADGSIVSDASSLTVGDLLRLRFGKGGALCRVDRIEADS